MPCLTLGNHVIFVFKADFIFFMMANFLLLGRLSSPRLILCGSEWVQVLIFLHLYIICNTFKAGMPRNVQQCPAFSNFCYFLIFLPNHDAWNHRIILFTNNFSKITVLQANLSFILESFHAKTSKNMKKKWNPKFLISYFFTPLTDTFRKRNLSWF